MAAKKKSKSKSAAKRTPGKCKTVVVCGRRRILCFTAKGKIKSNKPAGGGAGGRVAKKTASPCKTAAGRLKKGCRFVKGGGGRAVRTKKS